MNKVFLIGRLVTDPELKTVGADGINTTSFRIAVDRPRRDANGERQSDFINCVAWRNTAAFISQFFQKGRKIAVEGSIQTRTWDGKDGTKHYATDIVVDSAEFADSNPNSGGQAQPRAAAQKPKAKAKPQFTEVEEEDMSLPF